MKKSIIYLTTVALTIIVTTTSCGNNRETNRNQENITTTEQRGNMQETQTPTSYEGTYEGTMPCADCSGINVELKLTNGNYTMKMTYEGKEQGNFETTGMYTFDSNTRIITLGNETPPNKYEVGENMLYSLDANGNRITGDMADMYILRKK